MPSQKRTNNNVRMISRFLEWMYHSRGRADSTIDQIAASLTDFETFNAAKDHRNFKGEWARRYKKDLSNRTSKRTGEKLAVTSVNSRLDHLRSFFEWLSDQPGYRSRVIRSDVSDFSPLNNDRRAAVSRPRRKIPSLEQVRHIVFSMPGDNEIQMRNRALVAFVLLTGARADAAASFPLGKLDVQGKCAFFDGRVVRTKNRKGYTADFFPVGADIEFIVVTWEAYLREQKLFGPSDPLFPATLTMPKDRLFAAHGISREFWKSSEPIRRIFEQACENAGLPYFNPHSVRTTLGLLAQKLCTTAEEMKIMSQALGHESVETTFRSYGEVGPVRQAELMAMLRNRGAS